MEDVVEQNKLFLGGISWETTEDVLKEHFGKYGVVSVCTVAKDKMTGISRGFGFVTFTESSAVDRALQDSHQILNRKVEVKRAIPRSEQQKHDRSLSRPNGTGHYHQFRTKKIFVGGLSANLTEQEFRTYFEKFGKITDVVVMHDNMTHRPRGFGFITFESEDSVDEVMKQNFHELAGKLVEVKRAVPKDGASSSGSVSSSNITGPPNGMFMDYNTNNNPNLSLYPQQSDYSPYGPRFGYFPNISAYPYGVGVYDNGFPNGGYGPSSYGLTPFAPRAPWDPSLIGFRGGFVPYGNVVPFYPTYLNSNSGLLGLPSDGFGGVLTTNAFNGKLMQSEGRDSQNMAASSLSHNGMYTLDANSSSFIKGDGVGSSKNSVHLSSKGKDKSYSVTTAISSSS